MKIQQDICKQLLSVFNIPDRSFFKRDCNGSTTLWYKISGEEIIGFGEDNISVTTVQDMIDDADFYVVNRGSMTIIW